MPIDKVGDKEKSCNCDKSISMTLCFYGVKIHALELFFGYKNLVILLKLGRVNWIQKKLFRQYKHCCDKTTLFLPAEVWLANKYFHLTFVVMFRENSVPLEKYQFSF